MQALKQQTPRMLVAAPVRRAVDATNAPCARAVPPAPPKRERRRGPCSTLWLAVAALVAGCTSMAPVNPPIEQVNSASGYRAGSVILTRQLERSDALVLLAFSGGGTRAAALSFGVLEELRRQRVPAWRGGHTMLEEVDMITGVSGGSFTALGYALHGERFFDEFEARFLKRDVQGELIARTLDPRRWPALASDLYGRSELAADYYDEILFHGATFADLAQRDAPVAIVSGTDVSTGARFEFSQDTFDPMCSDLGPVRLARAAAASSAVPVVLTPVTFRNYGGRCAEPPPAWLGEIENPLHRSRPAGRALLRARDLMSLQDGAARPYIHVIDGGVSDNLGLRGILEGFEALEASAQFRTAVQLDRVRHILVIVVNSRSAPTTTWDQSPTPPGLLSQLFQASSVPIDRYSYESVELLMDIARRWENRRQSQIMQLRLAGHTAEQAQATVPSLSFDAIDVSFDAIEDAQERRYFMELPTSFSLPSEAVDRLRAVGGRLLRESPQFKAMLARYATPPAAPAPAPAPAPR